MQQDLVNIVSGIQGIIVAIAGIVFIICVIVAGLMRMLSFGNERRVAVSNMALTAAVVGLIIMAAAIVLKGWITHFFPDNPIAPPPAGPVQALTRLLYRL